MSTDDDEVVITPAEDKACREAQALPPPLHDSPLKVDGGARNAAHRALDHWLHQCEENATAAWECGRSGHVGQLTIVATSNDEGVSLTVERSWIEPLP